MHAMWRSWCDAAGLNLHQEIQKRATALQNTTDHRKFWYQCPCLKAWEDCWNPSTGAPPEWIGKLCDSWRFFDDHHDNWKSTASIIQALAIRAPYNSPTKWNDADYLMTGGQGCPNQTVAGLHCPGQTDTEYVSEFTLWCAPKLLLHMRFS